MTQLSTLSLPNEVETVFGEFRTCELSTLARDGTPITWPIVAFSEPPETERFLFTTSIGLPQKAFNIRRNPRVSLLFSEPMGSDLTDPPYVLVQGCAEAPDRIETSIETSFPGSKERFKIIAKRQPAGAMMSGSPLMRYLMDWYYMRIFIWVRPQRILWWDHGNFSNHPDELALENQMDIDAQKPALTRKNTSNLPTEEALWNKIVRHLADFQSAVLTGVDADGYPFSVRCKPKLDTKIRSLCVEVPDYTDIQPGSACLLYHRHDELLWNVKSFIVRCTLEKDENIWKLRPHRFIPGLGVGNFYLSFLQMIRSGRRTAKRYLNRRGLPRPKIPWDEIREMYA